MDDFDVVMIIKNITKHAKKKILTNNNSNDGQNNIQSSNSEQDNLQTDEVVAINKKEDKHINKLLNFDDLISVIEKYVYYKLKFTCDIIANFANSILQFGKTFKLPILR